MRGLRRWAVSTALVAGGLFALAGTWSDPWLWAFVAVASSVTFYALTSIDEDLARERFTPSSPSADRVWLRLIRVVALVQLVVGALDVRFGWTSMTGPLRVIGIAGFGLAFALMVYAMKTNRFFSAVIRVQADRGHHVVDRGPYGVVRHPGYAAMILAVPLSALALGSWIAFAIALVYSAMIVRRVIFEDRFLHSNLEGYRQYAARVPYRLMPGVW